MMHEMHTPEEISKMSMDKPGMKKKKKMVMDKLMQNKMASMSEKK